jgi:hypothetical protein
MFRYSIIRRPFYLLPLLLVLTLGTLSARAQVGVYATFSAGKYDLANTGWVYGPTLGVYDDAFHFPLVSFGFDARASILGSGGSTQLTSGMVGPRISAHLPLIPLKPYVEGLVGASHVVAGQGTAHTDDLFLQTGVTAGADLTIFPRLDWRVAEYSYSRFPGLDNGVNQKSLSTGLVLRLPIP